MAWNGILANEGNAETLSQFRQLFTDYEDLDSRKFTPLHRIILQLDNKDLRTSLASSSRGDIYLCDARGLTPLQWAARGADSETINLLLQYGADLNRPSIKGFRIVTALTFAAKRGDTRSVDLLLRYDVNVDAREKAHITPFLSTFLRPNPHLTCAKRLLDRGAMANVQDSQGATALLYASQYSSVAGVEFLLEYDAEIDLSSFVGETPLVVAIETNAHGTIPILLAHGANQEHFTRSGRSLPHEAAENGDGETLQLLTSARIGDIKIQHRSLSGRTAWDLARMRVDVTPNWRFTFANLIASVEENTPKPFPSTPDTTPKDTTPSSIRLSSMVKSFEDEFSWRGGLGAKQFETISWVPDANAHYTTGRLSSYRGICYGTVNSGG